MARLVGGLVLALALAGLLPSAAAAQPAPPVPCPAVMPTSEVAAATGAGAALPASGLTVAQGTEPEPFDVRVLGVLPNAVAPGIEMIVVEVDSPTLRRVGGIWQGMSGSPVYAADGRWIGALARRLSFGTSRIGGLASAEDMARVLTYAGEAPGLSAQRAVRLPPRIRRAVSADAGASERELDSGLAPLPVSLAASGVSPERASELARQLFGPRATAHVAPAFGPGPGPGPGDLAQVKPGGNLATAIAYGDVNLAPAGTTTVVCDGSALGFGHQFEHRGPVGLSAHVGSAVTIATDGAFGPSKILAVGGVVGRVDQDRFAAVRARLGEAPVPIPVTSTVADAGTGSTRSGLTNVNETFHVPMVAPIHLDSTISVVADRTGPGRSRVSWTATGTAVGRPFALTRENRFVAVPAADESEDLSDSISAVSAEELGEALTALVDNRFADVAFTSVRIDAAVATQIRHYRIEALERREGDGWVRIDPAQPLPAVAGAPLVVRALLEAYRDYTPDVAVELSIDVPAEAAGAQGTLEVRGGGEEAPSEAGPTVPSSFDELLASLEGAPRNDDVIAELRWEAAPGEAPPASTARGRVDEVVDGSVSVPVMAAGGEPEPNPEPTAP